MLQRNKIWIIRKQAGNRIEFYCIGQEFSNLNFLYEDWNKTVGKITKKKSDPLGILKQFDVNYRIQSKAS